MGIIRRTKAVKAILTKFEQTNNAISVVGLIEEFGMLMNKSTVYRILDRLEDDGTLHSFTGRDGNKWYAKCNNCSNDAHNDLHPHFQCVACGKVDCLPINISIPELPEREILASQILIQGKCELCIDN